jgi:hypothetical protein
LRLAGSLAPNCQVAMTMAYPRRVGFLRSTTLRDGQWYLNAVFGRNLQDPPHLWLILEGERSILSACKITGLLKEVLIQTSWRPGY